MTFILNYNFIPEWAFEDNDYDEFEETYHSREFSWCPESAGDECVPLCIKHNGVWKNTI